MTMTRDMRRRQQQWAGRLGRAVARFDGDQEGAVALMSVAALLIIFMLLLVMYDVGLATREKVKVQAATDVAAYSQAAIKARSMNMLAYTNIAKRSIWGIHAMYPSYMKTMYDWTRTSIDNNCGDCDGEDDSREECRVCQVALAERDNWISASCESTRTDAAVTADPNCDPDNPISWGPFRHMHGGDRMELEGVGILDYTKESLKLDESGSSILDVTTFEPGRSGARRPLLSSDPQQSLAQKYYARDLQALDNYQRYLHGITPWWSWMEQLIRSSRSGATISVSGPMPMAAWPLGLDDLGARIYDGIRRLFQLPPGFAFGSTRVDRLPVRPAAIGTMRDHIAGIVGPAPGRILSTLTNCISSLFSTATCSVRDTIHPFIIEHLVNGTIFFLKSQGVLRFEEWDTLPVEIVTVDGATFPMVAPVALHLRGLFADYVEHGLPYTHKTWQNVMISDDGTRQEHIAAEPWTVRSAQTQGEWGVMTSNIVLGFRQQKEAFSHNRKKYDFMSTDYKGMEAKQIVRRSFLYGRGMQPALGLDLVRQEVLYSASGQWSMARGEVFFQGDPDAPDTNLPDLWHPSWTARLRPVVLDNDMIDGDYSFQQIYHDSLPGLALASILGITSVSDVWSVLADLAYMEKVTLALDGPAQEGVLK